MMIHGGGSCYPEVLGGTLWVCRTSTDGGNGNHDSPRQGTKLRVCGLSAFSLNGYKKCLIQIETHKYFLVLFRFTLAFLPSGISVNYTATL